MVHTITASRRNVSPSHGLTRDATTVLRNISLATRMKHVFVIGVHMAPIAMIGILDPSNEVNNNTSWDGNPKMAGSRCKICTIPTGYELQSASLDSHCGVDMLGLRVLI